MSERLTRREISHLSDSNQSWHVCICEHEPHTGKCAERVGGEHGAPFPCGCDEYSPNREASNER